VAVAVDQVEVTAIILHLEHDAAVHLEPAKDASLFWVFRVFVPSLSWWKDHFPYQMAQKMRFAHLDWEGYVSISDTAFTCYTTLLCQAMLKRKRKRKRKQTEPKTTEKELNEYTSAEAQAREAAEQQQQP
jgi:hypothetical protein